MSSQRRSETEADEVGALQCWLGTGRDRRNKMAHIRWSILLSASLLASAFLLKAGIGGGAWLKWAIAALPIALWVPTLLAYLRFLREADELVRKIQMEGIAVGFWAGIGSGIGYIVLEDAGLPRLDPSMAVAIIVAVMMLAYAAGRFRASKRYR